MTKTSFRSLYLLLVGVNVFAFKPLSAEDSEGIRNCLDRRKIFSYVSTFVFIASHTFRFLLALLLAIVACYVDDYLTFILSDIAFCHATQ